MNAAATQPPQVRSIRFTRSSFPLSSAHEIKPTLPRRRRRSPSSSRARNKTVRPTVRVVVSRARESVPSRRPTPACARPRLGLDPKVAVPELFTRTDTHTHVAVHDSSTRINIDDIDDPGRSTRRRRQSDDDATRARLNEQSEPTTMSTARVPLNDGENLAVGAFGGIVETVVQSAYRVSRVRVRRRRRMNGWMDG